MSSALEGSALRVDDCLMSPRRLACTILCGGLLAGLGGAGGGPAAALALRPAAPAHALRAAVPVRHDHGRRRHHRRRHAHGHARRHGVRAPVRRHHGHRHPASRPLPRAHRVSVSPVPAPAPPLPRLRFGIYPWGAPGAVGQVAPQLADDPAQAMSAVRALAGARSMTVHLYGQYTGADPSEADALVSDAQWWSDAGIQVEMVLRYRPAAPALAAGYVPWVRAVAARLAADRK